MPRTSGPPRHAFVISCCAAALCCALATPGDALGKVPLRKATEWVGDRKLSGKARMKMARKRKLAEVKKLIADAGVTWPPYRVLFRVYKKESELEVWARDRKGKLKGVARYAICAASGKLGPKTRQGDEQVPEGFYRTTIQMPWTRYWMGVHINYPNGRDKRLRYTGSAIMIHGACASIGCMAMTDERIMELWLLIRRQRPRRSVPVHIYPARDLAGLIAKTKRPELKAFWRQLKRGRDLVDSRGKLPRISWTRRGVYRFR